jgi:DNA mismatch repair ATPase MutL
MDAERWLLEIADDGAGILAGEIELAIARHTTSKLLSARDLFNISTWGVIIRQAML